MSWTTALVAGTQIAAGRQADAAGKFNQKIENRNALVKEEEGKVLENKLKLDLEKFDKKFEELEGEVITSVLFSGATLQGSGLRILKKNKEEAELEKEVIEYNSKVEQSRVYEQANFARMRGQLARQQGRTAALGYYAQAGSTLLSSSSKSGGSSTPQTFNLTYDNYNPPR
tara:strand:+ start:494 stop:1006 length:513 start_codon:yes stop_codon:yes gene_type:complete